MDTINTNYTLLQVLPPAFCPNSVDALLHRYGGLYFLYSSKSGTFLKSATTGSMKISPAEGVTSGVALRSLGDDNSRKGNPVVIYSLGSCSSITFALPATKR